MSTSDNLETLTATQSYLIWLNSFPQQSFLENGEMSVATWCDAEEDWGQLHGTIKEYTQSKYMSACSRVAERLLKYNAVH